MEEEEDDDPASCCEADDGDFETLDLFSSTPIPSQTKSRLQNLSQSSIISQLEEFRGTFVTPTEACNYPCDLTSSNITKVTTFPSNYTIHYRLTPVYLNPQNQPYALLMLNFADNASKRLAGFLIDYNVKINGTDFNFEENATTDTGLDIKIISGVPSIAAPTPTGNYSMVIDIVNKNNIPVNEKTRPVSVNFNH